MRTIAIAMLLGAACAGLAPEAAAQATQATQSTKTAKPTKYYTTVTGNIAPVTGAFEATLTFSQPVQVPRMKLPAGTYLFKAITPTTMSVSNQDGTTVYTTFTILPASRTKDVSDPQLRFEVVAAGVPPRLIGLFPENSTSGYQPLFSKKQIRAGEPVATAGVK